MIKYKKITICDICGREDERDYSYQERNRYPDGWRELGNHTLFCAECLKKLGKTESVQKDTLVAQVTAL